MIPNLGIEWSPSANFGSCLVTEWKPSGEIGEIGNYLKTRYYLQHLKKKIVAYCLNYFIIWLSRRPSFCPCVDLLPKPFGNPLVCSAAKFVYVTLFDVKLCRSLQCTHTCDTNVRFFLHCWLQRCSFCYDSCRTWLSSCSAVNTCCSSSFNFFNFSLRHRCCSFHPIQTWPILGSGTAVVVSTSFKSDQFQIAATAVVVSIPFKRDQF